MEKNTQDKSRALEAVLFIYGDPITYKKIAKILDIEESGVVILVNELQANLKDRGLSLIVNDESVQLATKPEFSGMVEAIIKEELSQEITPAAIETLAIISYLGPLPRSRIDYIRGVNSSYILRNLLLRGLVERLPDPHRGNAFLYKVSFDLLKHFGVGGVEELPEFDHYRNLLTKSEQALGAESEKEKNNQAEPTVSENEGSETVNHEGGDTKNTE